jgi:hypothetical protein
MWIRIGFNADPISDPAFEVNSDPGSGSRSLMTKNGKILQIFIFLIKNGAIYLSLALHKGRPNYRRSVQPSKENIQKCGSGSGPADQNQCGSIRI